MKRQPIVVLGLLVILVAGCAQGAPSMVNNRSIVAQPQSTSTLASDATEQSVTRRFPELVTTYEGTPLPSPSGENGALRNFFPPAWLVVGEQRVPGMYLSFGGGEYLPDVSKMPVVEIPDAAEPVVVVGAGPIMEFTPSVIDWNKQRGGTLQRLVATPEVNEPTAFTLAPIKAATSQRLDVFVQFQHLETVSYGWKLVFPPNQ